MGSSITAPAGWTRFDSVEVPMTDNVYSTSPNLRCWCYTRIIQAGDANTSINFTQSSTGVWVIAMGVWGGTSGLSVGPAIGRNSASPAQDGGTHPRIPEIYPGPNDLVVCFGTTRTWTSLTEGDALLSTAPTGFTMRQNVARQLNVLQLSHGAWMCDGPANIAKLKTLVPTNVQQSWNVAAAFSLCPTGQSPYEQLPASLRGVRTRGYGTSYFSWVPGGVGGGGTTIYGQIDELPMPERVLYQVNGSDMNSMGMPGAFAVDISGFAYGSVVYSTRAQNTNTGYTTPQVGTWAPPHTGLVICDLFGNDGIHDGDTAPSTQAKSRAGAQNAADSLVRLIRSSAYKPVTNGSIAYSGTWTTNSGINDIGGNTNKRTTTNGDTITITATQQNIDLLFLALDDDAATTAVGSSVVGSTFSVTVDGSAWTTGTTSQQMKKSASTLYNQAYYCTMAVPVYGMSPGSHTIVITNTGTTGKYLFFNGYLEQVHSTPPIILLNKLAHYDPTLFFTAFAPNSSNAQFDYYSNLAETIAKQFPDGRVVTFNPLESGEWDWIAMTTSVDYIHPNDRGTGFYGHGMIRTLQERVA